MGSRKPSAWAKQRASFEAGAPDLSDLFSREDERSRRAQVEREQALERKACTSKNRYSTRAEAKEAIASCAEYGRRGLHCYRCPYCEGWHLTSHPREDS